MRRGTRGADCAGGAVVINRSLGNGYQPEPRNSWQVTPPICKGFEGGPGPPLGLALHPSKPEVHGRDARATFRTPVFFPLSLDFRIYPGQVSTSDTLGSSCLWSAKPAIPENRAVSPGPVAIATAQAR